MSTLVALGLAVPGVVLAAALLRRPHRSVLAAVAAACLWLAASGLAAFSVGPAVFATPPALALTAALAIVPAVAFARWTQTQTHLVGRNAMHGLSYILLLAWDLPWLVVRYGDGSMSAWGGHPSWVRSLLLQLLCIPAVLGVSALIEYTVRGRGSPMPLDPPRSLVTTGPFAYVANPMQMAKVLTVLTWALVAQSWFLLAVAITWLLVGAAMTEPGERPNLRVRFGAGWLVYRNAVRVWWPRWRPWRDPSRPAARILVAGACGPCQDLAAWLGRQRPVGLRVDSADSPLAEIEYTDGSVRAAGVVALARAIEHINCGWAVFGWCVRLPGVAWVAQIIYDASSQRASSRP